MNGIRSYLGETCFRLATASEREALLATDPLTAEFFSAQAEVYAEVASDLRIMEPAVVAPRLRVRLALVEARATSARVAAGGVEGRVRAEAVRITLAQVLAMIDAAER